MSCTTILVGKKASYNGSTMIARNDDCAAGSYTPKHLVVVEPKDMPKKYKPVISEAEIELPEKPMRFMCVPNAEPDLSEEGIWAAAGVNEKNISMTATETITSNERVLAADPLWETYKKDGHGRAKGGIGEEDLLYLTLPYIKSAREGVYRVAELLERYGTYEMNGMAFSDRDEIWWLETIGGHHFIAKRVPDEAVVIMPNQFGLDRYDFSDALGDQIDHICSPDMLEFIEEFDLDLTNDIYSEGMEYYLDEIGEDEVTEALDDILFNPRDAFGSHDDADHVYNTPRAWFMGRYLCPMSYTWDGEDADFTPYTDNIPWCVIPERLVTPEDVKYLLSSHYQGTPYDPYLPHGDKSMSGAFRSIGVNRTSFMSLTEIRQDKKQVLFELCFGSNVFNAMIPLYADVKSVPEYFAFTPEKPSAESFYWANRMIGALADASYKESLNHIERYQQSVQSKCKAIINRYDKLIAAESGAAKKRSLMESANESIAELTKKETTELLDKVLYEASNIMKNAYARSDA